MYSFLLSTTFGAFTFPSRIGGRPLSINSEDICHILAKGMLYVP